MTREEILSHVDHTLLAPDATWSQVKTLCDQAKKYRTASVCVSPCQVERAAEYLGAELPVCTVIGFPSGAATTKSKVFEAADAISKGAREIDMVINIGLAKEGAYSQVEAEIRAVKAVCGDHILKVIVETCLLTREEKIALCGCVTRAGADYIKTSTGFSAGGATREDVALLRRYSGPQVEVKAAGGIQSFQDGEDFLALGADRLGTSRLVKLMEAQNA